MDANETIEALIKLHNKNYEIVKNTGKAGRTIIKAFLYLEHCPIIDIKKTSAELKLSFREKRAGSWNLSFLQ